MSKHKARGRWNSRRGFLLAAIGSAVGLGNIWRFPYTAYENGGGAFLLPYLIALCLVGIPLMLLEQGMGHRFRSALPMACAKINRKWEAVGWWAVIFPMFGILLYYNVIISWCFNYLGYSLTLAWGTDTGSFFMQEFLGVSSGPSELGGFRWAILAGAVFVWAIIWQIVSRGVGSGIEKVSRLFMPILFVQMMVLVAWSVFLPGASEGIAAYLTPDPSRLLDSKVWSAAFGQIFFSLSLGMGIMVAYSSYLPERAKVGQNSLITAFANSGFEIFAGFAVFSTLGYMAFKSGLPVAKVASGGAGLAFVAYPKAISLLPFASKLFGVIFFSALIFAGITSAISIFESFVSSIIDKFGVARKKVVTVCCGLGCLGSLVFTTGAGVHWLEIVDYF